MEDIYRLFSHDKTAELPDNDVISADQRNGYLLKLKYLGLRIYEWLDRKTEEHAREYIKQHAPQLIDLSPNKD